MRTEFSLEIKVIWMRLDGFKTDAVGALANHWTRHSGDPDQERHVYRNGKIDKSRTHLNYALMCEADEYQAICRRIREINDSCDRKSTSRTNVVSCAVVTLPKGWPDARDPREFFEAAADELAEQVGRDNVVGAFVHMDETTPHEHFVFVAKTRTARMVQDTTRPLRWTRADEKRNKAHRAGTPKTNSRGQVQYERVPVLGEDGRPVTDSVVSQAAMFDRARLKGWHDDTADGISRRLGFRVDLRLGEDQELERALSSVPHGELDRARRAAERKIEAETAGEREALAEAKAETAAANDRLESVRRRTETLAAVAEEGPRAAEAILRDGGRAERAERERDELAAQVGQLAARARELEREVEQRREGVERLERRAEAAAGQVRSTRARAEGLERAVRERRGLLEALVERAEAAREVVVAKLSSLQGAPVAVVAQVKRLLGSGASRIVGGLDALREAAWSTVAGRALRDRDRELAAMARRTRQPSVMTPAQVREATRRALNLEIERRRRDGEELGRRR